MYSPTRRNERRRDVIDELRKSYRINALIDYSSYEQRGLHLEGTGSLVLDYVNRIAYVSLSNVPTAPGRNILPGLWASSRCFSKASAMMAVRSITRTLSCASVRSLP